MADGIMNIAKGRIVELYNRVEGNDPANSAFTIVLLKVAEADATLEDYDDLAALLGAAGNTEADFTDIGARKEITDTTLAALPAPDDTNNRYEVDMPDITWTGAGNGTNNNVVKILICYDADTTTGDDTNIIPLIHFDFVATTDNSDLTAQFNSLGFFRAT